MKNKKLMAQHRVTTRIQKRLLRRPSFTGSLAITALVFGGSLLLQACSGGDVSSELPQAPYEVSVQQQAFVDTSRETPPSGDTPAQATRTLETQVYVPQGFGQFPLLVFSHGLGATPQFYAELIDSVASAGFVIVAPAFPLTNGNAPSGPDPADTQQQPGDISFLIDSVIAAVEAGEAPFAGLVDVERVGTFGHSNGGITTLGIAANSCCLDPRIDASVVLAGNPAPFANGEYDFTNTQPVLLAHGTEDALVAYDESVRVFNAIHAAKGMLTLNGLDHGSYLVTSGPGFDTLRSTIVDFFSAHLLGDTEASARLESEEVLDSLAELRYAARDGASVTLPVAPPITNREATVEPTTGLTNGQLVTVSWSNFTPGLTINVLQCSNGGTEGAATCDFDKGEILKPNPTGEGSMELEIIVGDVGSGRCDATVDDCVIVINDGGLADPNANIRIPITFAP